MSVWTVNAVHYTTAVLDQLRGLRNASDPVTVQQMYGRPLAPDAFLDLRNTDAAGNVVARYQVPAAHVDAVMKHVGFNNIPFDHSSGAMQIFMNMFYPTDNKHLGEQLGYYRQREWRVVSGTGFNFNGRPIGRELSDPEKVRLLKIDDYFWSRTISVHGQPKRRVDLAHVYDPVPGFRLLDVVERVVVTKHLMPRVQAILKGAVRVEKLRTRDWWSRFADAWTALNA